MNLQAGVGVAPGDPCGEQLRHSGVDVAALALVFLGCGATDQRHVGPTRTFCTSGQALDRRRRVGAGSANDLLGLRRSFRAPETISDGRRACFRPSSKNKRTSTGENVQRKGRTGRTPASPYGTVVSEEEPLRNGERRLEAGARERDSPGRGQFLRALGKSWWKATAAPIAVVGCSIGNSATIRRRSQPPGSTACSSLFTARGRR